MIAIALAITLIFGFVVETAIQEFYNGPFASQIYYLPTVTYSLGIATLQSLYGSYAKACNDFERYETNTAYTAAMARKLFIFTFITVTSI